MASESTKLDVLGVKLQINEVEKLNFYIHFKNNDWNVEVIFVQICNQQLIFFVVIGLIQYFLLLIDQLACFATKTIDCCLNLQYKYVAATFLQYSDLSST